MPEKRGMDNVGRSGRVLGKYVNGIRRLKSINKNAMHDERDLSAYVSTLSGSRRLAHATETTRVYTEVIRRPGIPD